MSDLILFAFPPALVALLGLVALLALVALIRAWLAAARQRKAIVARARNLRRYYGH